eukprot:2219355-Pleurochrysis_carterae.AAC.1
MAARPRIATISSSLYSTSYFARCSVYNMVPPWAHRFSCPFFTITLFFLPPGIPLMFSLDGASCVSPYPHIRMSCAICQDLLDAFPIGHWTPAVIVWANLARERTQLQAELLSKKLNQQHCHVSARSSTAGLATARCTATERDWPDARSQAVTGACSYFALPSASLGNDKCLMIYVLFFGLRSVDANCFVSAAVTDERNK